VQRKEICKRPKEI